MTTSIFRMSAIIYFMSSNSESEAYNRQYPRIHLELKADCRILDPEKYKTWFPLSIKTLGGGGVMFISPVSLSEGTLLQMRIFYYAHMVEFTAEVVWIKPTTGRRATGTECGLKYAQISQDHLLQIHHILQTIQ